MTSVTGLHLFLTHATWVASQLHSCLAFLPIFHPLLASWIALRKPTGDEYGLIWHRITFSLCDAAVISHSHLFDDARLALNGNIRSVRLHTNEVLNRSTNFTMHFFLFTQSLVIYDLYHIGGEKRNWVTTCKWDGSRATRRPCLKFLRAVIYVIASPRSYLHKLQISFHFYQ